LERNWVHLIVHDREEAQRLASDLEFFKSIYDSEHSKSKIKVDKKNWGDRSKGLERVIQDLDDVQGWKQIAVPWSGGGKQLMDLISVFNLKYNIRLVR